MSSSQQPSPLLTTGFMLTSTLLGHLLAKYQKEPTTTTCCKINKTVERKTIVSAPGKVLITGGYLVLDPDYSGLVLSTSSRFYTTIQDVQNVENSSDGLVIDLHSPQFYLSGQYVYQSNENGGELKLVNMKKNPYIENAILYALAISEYLNGTKIENRKISITLQADNDFYSQRQNLIDLGKEVTLENLENLEKFYVHPDSNKPIQKTGLGSSASMVTSLTSALILHFTNLDINSENGRELIHRVAQFCHCLAQGKIGSGFDVSAATYGSQRYKRFGTSILESIMKLVDPSDPKYSKQAITEIINVVDPKKEFVWDNENSTFELPPNFHLFVADVAQGSNTPSMVRCVLKWKEQNPTESTELWNSIRDLNNTVEEQFKIISTQAKEFPSDYENTLQQLYQLPASEWEGVESVSSSIKNAMLTIRNSFIEIRKKLKYMGEQAEDVPIEPNQQTKLLDETMATNGCLIAGVPGAGGYDAVFSILFAPNEQTIQQVKTQVESSWKNFKYETECFVTPLILNESKTKGLEVQRF